VKVTREPLLIFAEKYRIQVEGISDEAFQRPVPVRKVIVKRVG
jgi:hypothetical protein